MEVVHLRSATRTTILRVVASSVIVGAIYRWPPALNVFVSYRFVVDDAIWMIEWRRLNWFDGQEGNQADQGESEKYVLVGLIHLF